MKAIEALRSVSLRDTELDSDFACRTTTVCSTDGSACSDYEYCIGSIDQPERGVYTLNMNCTRTITDGSGVGGYEVFISVIADGSLDQTLTAEDCGSGFPDTITGVESSEGGPVSILIEWNAHGGGVVQLDATLPDPSGDGGSGSTFEENTEVVGCRFDRRALDTDSTLEVSARVTIVNNNDQDAVVSVDWFVDDVYIATEPELALGRVIPANSQDFLDVTLPAPSNWDVDAGQDLPTRAQIGFAEPA